MDNAISKERVSGMGRSGLCESYGGLGFFVSGLEAEKRGGKR